MLGVIGGTPVGNFYHRCQPEIVPYRKLSDMKDKTDLRTLASRAAQSSGFSEAQAETFGRAAEWHLAEGRDCGALLRALGNTDDSPIVRLPLMLGDLMAACAALNGTAELTLNRKDTELAPSYARLLPVHLAECEVVLRAEQPRLRISTDTARTSEASKADIVPPDDLVRSLRQIVRPTALKQYSKRG